MWGNHVKHVSSLVCLVGLPRAVEAFAPALRVQFLVPTKIGCRTSRSRFAAPDGFEPIGRFKLLRSILSKRRGAPEQLKSEAENFEYFRLKKEIEILRETVRQLESENGRLQQASSKIVIESFEGERRRSPVEAVWYNNSDIGSTRLAPREIKTEGITMSGDELESSPLWCDDLDGDVCPVEPTVSFMDAMRDRAYWLVGLLALQSCSGFILSRNEALLESHPVIIYFLTMLVGAGGNAGNQASVRVIRGLALGTLNDRTQSQFLWRELKMAAVLSSILCVAGFLRAFAFATPIPETFAITSALALIVFSSICLGAVLPLLLKKLGVDPAHSSTTIQVVMDILGVVLTVVVSTAVLDSPMGTMLISKLIGSS